MEKLEGGWKRRLCLKEKLRLLKDKLGSWNNEVFGNIELEMEDGVCNLNLTNDRLISDVNINFESTMEFRKEVCSISFGGI